MSTNMLNGRWSTFDPTPSFDSTPWQYREVSSLQGSKAFGFLAPKAGAVLAPALGVTGALVCGVARLDPMSIHITGALVGALLLEAAYCRRYLACRHREPLAQQSVSVSDARLYSRHRVITTALEACRR